MDSLTIVCRFCKGKIGASNGQLGKLESHMLHSHDMYYEKDLSFLLNFLGDEEIDILVTKLSVRMNLFKSGGILSFDSNVFGDSPEADRDFGKKDVQKFEDPNESDEEIETLFEKSERGRCLEDEEQIRGDSDDDNAEDRKNDDDHQTELPGNDHLHNVEEHIGNTVTEFEDEQKQKIENLLLRGRLAPLQGMVALTK